MMAIVAMNTNNPLGQRPFGAMGHLGAFATTGPMQTPGSFDENKGVLDALVSMGAITAQNEADIWAGKTSLDDMAVPMNMISQALQLSGQVGLPIAVTNPAVTNVVATAPTWSVAGSVGSAISAVTPSSSLTDLGLTGTTGIIVGAVAVGLLLVLIGRR